MTTLVGQSTLTNSLWPSQIKQLSKCAKIGTTKKKQQDVMYEKIYLRMMKNFLIFQCIWIFRFQCDVQWETFSWLINLRTKLEHFLYLKVFVHLGFYWICWFAAGVIDISHNRQIMFVLSNRIFISRSLGSKKRLIAVYLKIGIF